MRYSFLKTLVFLFITVIAIIFVDVKFFNRRLTHIGPILIKKPASYLFTKLEKVNFFTKKLVNARNLVAENESLKNENLNLLSQFADYEDIKDENKFLRKSLNITPRFRGEIIYADIFNSQLGPSGYDVLITKGEKNGVNDNNVVITEEGVLIGRVKKSYDDFAQLLIVNDPKFSIMVKILNSGTAGIAKGAINKGLSFELVTQGDLIKEGDVVVSSGMDFFPPALIIGTVSYVEINESALFKKVKIKPAIDNVKMGRVLVVKNNTQ